MKKLNHENILKLISSFEDEHNHYLVIEICNKLVTNLFIVEFE
jgi:serine/threonine protein kinase